MFGGVNGGQYARTKHSSSGSRRFNFIAWRTLLGRWMGARYAILNPPGHEKQIQVCGRRLLGGKRSVYCP